MLEKDARERDREARERGENPAESGWSGSGSGKADELHGSQLADESGSTGPDQALGGPPQASDTVRGERR